MMLSRESDETICLANEWAKGIPLGGPGFGATPV
jgi:hypothetical protein